MTDFNKPVKINARITIKQYGKLKKILAERSQNISSFIRERIEKAKLDK